MTKITLQKRHNKSLRNTSKLHAHFQILTTFKTYQAYAVGGGVLLQAIQCLYALVEVDPGKKFKLCKKKVTITNLRIYSQTSRTFSDLDKTPAKFQEDPA